MFLGFMSITNNPPKSAVRLRKKEIHSRVPPLITTIFAYFLLNAAIWALICLWAWSIIQAN